MKTSHQCPKCSSKQVVRLAGQTFMTKVYPTGASRSNYSLVDKYACTDCGYVEEYLADPEELAELKQALK